MIAYTRLIPTNRVVVDQVDVLGLDNFSRVTGLVYSAVESKVFYNNQAQPWPLVNGVTVTDAQVASGQVYFNEIVGQPGYYSVRFRPNAVGFWRVCLSFPTESRVAALGYDVVAELPQVASGLKASFTPLG